MASLEGIEAGALLAKYRIEERLGDDERAYFTATLEGTEDLVCVLELRGDEVEAYSVAAAKNPDHAHLARVREVFSHEGASLLVFDCVAGVTLTERLGEVGKKTQLEAVGTALRISDALSNLHDAGGVHGFIHTDSVLVDPPERLGPILTFAPVPSDERTFHSPERGETGKPSVADDAWAAAGLLHMMLTGSPPPKDGYSSVGALEEAGVEHPALRDALLNGLNKDEKERSQDIRPLKRELARWFVEHAGEDAALLPSHSTLPPPLPNEMLRTLDHGTPLNVVRAGPKMPAPKRQRFAVIAVVGTLVGLGAAWGLSAMRPAPPPAPSARPAPAAPVASARAIDLSEVPVTGEEQSKTVELDKLASCVASYLPKGGFGKQPELGWLCSETDPNKGAQQLRVVIVGNAPKGSLTDSMKLSARLGWYDMAAFAVVRTGCCDEPKALVAPAPSKGCDSMADALQELGKDVIAGRSYEEHVKKYAGAIHCELNGGHPQTFGRTQRPQPGEDTAFKELVDAIAR